nr:hypothetical protein Iba_chr03aCG10800 [Ipomoea batatas]GMC72241.1 hypothetical protein Iba_chr03bCG9720 [Ipomoea batatas]
MNTRSGRKMFILSMTPKLLEESFLHDNPSTTVTIARAIVSLEKKGSTGSEAQEARDKMLLTDHTICFFMSLSLSFSDISAIFSIELSSTVDPFSLSGFLLQCNAMQTEKICTK